MFSKEESKKIRQEFWTSFGKSFPQKWTLYNTKIKDVSFRFYFDHKKARVSINIEDPDIEQRQYYYNKFISLQAILIESIPDLEFSEVFYLENGKEISSIYIEKQGVSIHNKSTWQEVMYFLEAEMQKFEAVWEEFKDFIRD